MGSENNVDPAPVPKRRLGLSSFCLVVLVSAPSSSINLSSLNAHVWWSIAVIIVMTIYYVRMTILSLLVHMKPDHPRSGVEDSQSRA